MDSRAAEVSASPPHLSPHLPRPPRPLGFLVWIVLYKVVKVVFALSGGIVALRLMHRHDLAGDASWVLTHLRLDPEGRMGSKIVAQIAGINPNKLGWLTCVLFFYAVLYTIEGTGLYLEKRWAEWFTVFQTSLIIPPEIYAMVRHPRNPITYVMFATSITTVGYLLWRIRSDRKKERAERAMAAESSPPAA